MRLVAPAANRLFSGLIPDVCFGKLLEGLFTNGVLLSGFVVRCCSSGSEESNSGNPSLTVSTFEDGMEEDGLRSLKNEDLLGIIFGRIIFLVAVLNVFLGLNITTVSSIVVVKSTNPTYVTESSDVLEGLTGFSNL